uniref:N-6 DNA methylase n=1 Tax=Klebsiella pneumoniae TaxID=573 RepID=UPI00248029AC
NGGKNSLNRLIRCVCGKKIGPDPRNFNQRVSLGRNDLLIRTFLKKETNNNILTDGHIEKIMQVFASKADIDHLAKTIPYETVSANDYNLSVSSYVEAMDTREIVDIAELNAELKTTVSKIDQLRKDIDAIVAEIEGDEVRA